MPELKNKRGVTILKKFLSLILLIVILCTFFAFPISAVEDKNGLPYQSYTYWYGKKGKEKTPVYSKPIYEVFDVLAFNHIGLTENFVEITDVCTSEGGNTYILDGGASKIVILDASYKLSAVIESAKKGDENLSFKNAKGIFVGADDSIYVADTENKRVLKLDGQGNVIAEITLPKSRLIPSSFTYSPIKLTIDSKGYMYVLSDGSYHGAILYSPEGEFLGFYGANTVKVGVLDSLSALWKKLTLSNERRAALEKTLPYQFTDLHVDKKDFIYTTTGNVAKSMFEEQTGQIRKLSPGGSNVIDSDSVNFGDQGYYKYSQDILGIAVDDDGFIYALDSAYGHIFAYASDTSLLGVFGCGTREGIQKGSFSKACAIAVNKSDLIVADGKLNTVTVFRETDYGKKLKKAQSLTMMGDYKLAKPLWEQLIKEDRNNQLCYMGLAKAYSEEGNYEKALEYSKIGYDRDTYALAFEFVRNDYLEKNLSWITPIIIVLIIGIVMALRYKRKKGIIFLPPKWRLALSVLRHPSDTFYQIKQNNKGSALIAIVILLLFYVTSVLKETAGGFCYVVFDAETFNALLILFRSSGLVVLFTVCFWAVSTLMHGQGKIREIFITVCYSLLPCILANIMFVILTNIMLPSEIAFLDLLMTVMTLYTALLLFIGLMRISDYEFGTLVAVLLLTLAAMVIVVFVLVVLFLLCQLFNGFLSTIFSEIYKLIVFGG